MGLLSSRVSTLLRPLAVLLGCIYFVVAASAADIGDVERAYMAGDFDRAAALVTPLADSGDDQAEYMLGMMYLNGDGFERDYEKAAHWFEKSFENPWGFVRAGKIALAIMYHNGLGVEQDYIRAIHLLEEAANIGNPFDVYNFEKKPVNLIKARPNLEKSVAWFRKAAEEGDARAQFGLAIAYFRGLAVEPDGEQVFHWLQQSAEGGYARAQYYLASFYSMGDLGSRHEGADYAKVGGVGVDDAKAFYWHEKAALQDDADAQAMLGVAYFTGDGVPKDIEKAKFWLRKAIENGNTSAAEFWGWFGLGPYDTGELAGAYEDGTYHAPGDRFSVRYQLSGGSKLDPCCEETVDDWFSEMFDEELNEVIAFGSVSLSNEYGAINGVIYAASGIVERIDANPKLPLLQQWFYGFVLEVISEGAGELTVLHENSRQFHGMDAWIGVVSIPGGGVVAQAGSGDAEKGRLDSVRGFVVFERGHQLYALMCETNVLSFTGEARQYDPEHWDAFLDELSAFYATMTFK